MKDEMAYMADKPNVRELQGELNRSISDLHDISALDDVRFAKWDGQSRDGRKHSELLSGDRKAFPFEGASDTRILLADGVIRQITDMLVGAHQRAMCRVNGVDVNDTEPASAAATLVNWARKRIYNQLNREASLLANYQEQYGYALAMVSWDQQVSLRDETITIDDIVALAQQAESGTDLAILPQLIQDPAAENQIVDMFNDAFPQLKKRDVRKLVKELREEGSTTFPTPYICKNQPAITALKPQEDFIVGPECIEIQDARVIFRRQFLTEAELKSKVASEGWDEKFVEAALNTKGQMGSIDVEFFDQTNHIDRRDHLIEIWWAYHRGLDDNDVPAIYYTVFSALVKDDQFALHKRLPYAHGEYPFIAFRAEDHSRRMIDSRSVSDVCRTWQNEIKTQRDSIVDYTSINTLPPLQFLKRNGPVDSLSPAGQIPVTKIDDVKWLSPPAREPGVAFQVEEMIRRQVCEYFGLPHKDIPPTQTSISQQNKVQTWLRGWTDVYRHMFRLCLQYMDQSEIARVCGSEAAMGVTHDADKYDFVVTYNSDELNFDLTKEKLQTLSTAIVPMDVTGRVDRSKLIDKLIRAVMPEAADDLLVDQAQATKAIYDGVKSDIVGMANGIEAQYGDASNDPTAPTKMQIVQALTQQSPKIQQQLQQDQMFQSLMQNYVKHLEMGVMQQQNKAIGRSGVSPIQGGAQQ